MATDGDMSTSAGLARSVPILEWARSDDRAWLRPDLVAGLAVAVLVVPTSLVSAITLVTGLRQDEP